jgi:hypothetical protein
MARAGGAVPGLPIPVLAVVVSAIVFAPLCSWLALRNERSAALWFVFGVLLGPIAAALLIIAPPGRCPACGTRSTGWPRQCVGCGLEYAPARQVAAPDTDPARAATAAAAAAVERGPTLAARAAAGGREAVDTNGQTGETRPATRRSAASGSRSTAAAADLPGRRPATALGRRPTAISSSRTTASPAPRRSGGTVAILGSGIFMGGTDALQIGSRYFLARVGSEMHALGPMHISPSAVAARIHLGDTQATVVADRLLITGRTGNKGPTLAFSSVSAEPGIDLAEALKARARRKAAAT